MLNIVEEYEINLLKVVKLIPINNGGCVNISTHTRARHLPIMAVLLLGSFGKVT